MKHDHLTRMVKGWLVGNFQPAAYSTASCEVAVKHYRAGDVEPTHLHKIATEITVVILGRVRMVDREWSEGDILTLSPGEPTAFEALTDAITVVVKIPGALHDKYLM